MSGLLGVVGQLPEDLVSRSSGLCSELLHLLSYRDLVVRNRLVEDGPALTRR